MHTDESAARADLEHSLAQLAHLTGRIQELHAQHDAVVQRHTRPDRPLRSALSRSSMLIISVAVAVGLFVLASSSIYLLLVPSLVAAAAMLVAGLYGLVRGGPMRRLAPFMLVTAVVLLVLLFFPVWIPMRPWLLLLALGVAVFIGLKVRNVHTERFNRHIMEVNGAARIESRHAAEAELAPIQQEVHALQQAFHQGDYSAWFPEKYLDPHSVYALWEIVHDGRAWNIKEAVNQHVQDLHNQYMRSSADQQMAMAQMQLAQQEKTERAVHVASALNLGMQAFQGSRTRAAIKAPRTVYIRRD